MEWKQIPKVLPGNEVCGCVCVCAHAQVGTYIHAYNFPSYDLSQQLMSNGLINNVLTNTYFLNWRFWIRKLRTDDELAETRMELLFFRLIAGSLTLVMKQRRRGWAC